MPSCHKCGQPTIGDNIQCDDCKDGYRKELDYMDDDTFDPQEDDGSLDIEGDGDWLGGLSKVVKPKEKARDDQYGFVEDCSDK